MDALPNVTEWTGCYDESWQGLITPESYSHPAKMACGLLRRIIEHGLTEGYWRKGDLIGDPFFGIGSTGILGASYGLLVVGVELEARFCELAAANFEKHRHLWEASGDPFPVCIQGDSREFARLVGECCGVVTSPPYAETPIADARNAAGGHGRQFELTGKSPRARGVVDDDYGSTEGNIGNLKSGAVDGVVTSPPFTTAQEGGGICKTGTPAMQKTGGGPSGTGGYRADAQGNSPGQIANEKPEDYWQAMFAVYSQMHAAMKPNAVAAVVVKAFVKQGKIVDLPGDTCKLLESLGFEVFERVRAMLVKETRHPDLFGGEDHVETKSRKSFFRRLCEKRGSPAIDWEEVIWCR